MNSFHSIVKDEAPPPLAEEPPVDMMCMFDNIPYLDCPPKWDQYDDDQEAETEVVCSDKLVACHWQEEDHLPFRCDNQPLHNIQDSDGEETKKYQSKWKHFAHMFLISSIPEKKL